MLKRGRFLPKKNISKRNSVFFYRFQKISEYNNVNKKFGIDTERLENEREHDIFLKISIFLFTFQDVPQMLRTF